MADSHDVRREHGFHPLRVKAIVQETPDARSFVLEVPDDVADLFGYRPGQFCTFRVRLGDEELLRSYSMSSAPGIDPHLTVTVKRVEGGRVSSWLHDNVSEGDVLEATKPAGVFCPSESDRPVVAFAGGSGVTPIISIAKSLLASSSRPVKVLYANRDRESVIFDAQLEELVERHPGRLELRHHLDAEAGYVTAPAVREVVGADLDADFHICGPTPFMDLVESTLLELGVAPERIRIERFVNDGQRVPAAAAATPAEGAGDGGPEVPDEITLVVKGRRHTVDHQAGDTVLGTARRAGITTPYSCEAGNCATCMALCQEGSVEMRVNDVLTDDELAEGWVLTCQAEPRGRAVTIEFESF